VPFPGNDNATLYAHEYKEPPPPRQYRSNLPETVDRAILKMLAKAPADRYPSAVAFVDELQAAFAAGQRDSQTAPLYAALQAAHQRGDHSDVLVLGTKIESLQANYRDVPELIAQARQRHQTPPPAAERPARHGLSGWVWAAGVVALLLVACLMGLGLREVGDLLSGASVTATPTPAPTVAPTATAVAVVVPSTATATPPPTATGEPPTATSTATPVPPTDTATVPPPANTSTATNTAIPVPPTIPPRHYPPQTQPPPAWAWAAPAPAPPMA
jgi:hypothetical protein